MTGAGGPLEEHERQYPTDPVDWSAPLDGAAARPPTATAAAALSSSVGSQIESRFHLPPHQLASDAALYEGDAPNVLADNVLLHPHTAHLASTDPTGRTSTRPGLGSRTTSWHSALWATEDEQDDRGRKRSDSKRRNARGDRSSGTAAAPSSEPGAGPGAPEEQEEDHRDDYARSKSQRRKMPWYRRPSPIWFFPGTLVIALTMGMTIAPKLEIYTQLICRALPIDESGVTVPPPIFELGRGPRQPTPILDKHPSTADGQLGNATALQLEWQHDASSPVQHIGSFATGAAPGSPVSSDGEWAKQCHKSRAVQSQVARLALLLSLLMGVLSSLTTGYWGAFSDRNGRKPVLILALCGSLAMDVVFLLTVYYHSTLSYNFLLLGPFLDGLVGGWSTAQATSSAYISDVTSPGSRAKIFSAIGGLMYGGFAMGPFLGSLLVKHSRLSVLAPFYAALAMHAAYLLFLAILLPESLSPERKQLARERHQAEKLERRRLEREGPKTRGWKRVAQVAARPLAFLKPVALLLPQKPATTNEAGEPIKPEDRTNIEYGAHLKDYWSPEAIWKSPDPNGMLGTPGGRGAGKADWTLSKIALAWAAYMTLMAVMSVKLMYANFTFGWGPVEDGQYLSFLGILRVVMLVALIPLIIRLIRRKPAPLPLRPRPEANSKAASEWDHEKRWLRVVHDSHFDLSLARWSLFLDLCGFLLFLVAPSLVPPSMRGGTQHIALFLTAAVLQSFGSGASPAIQSLALAHASPRDAGRLFASLSVVQSIASQVIGPILFSTLFMQTVGMWSEAIFALATLLAALACLALALIRLRRVVVPDPGRGEASRGETADPGAASAAGVQQSSSSGSSYAPRGSSVDSATPSSSSSTRKDASIGPQ